MPPTSPINDLSGQEEAMTFLASNSSLVWGRRVGGEIDCGVRRSVTYLYDSEAYPQSQMPCLHVCRHLAPLLKTHLSVFMFFYAASHHHIALQV